MTVSELNAGTQVTGATAKPKPPRESFSRLKIGQKVELSVEQRLAEQRYVVRVDGVRHVVETAMALTAGTTFAATVQSIGDKLELRYVAASPGSSSPVAIADSLPDRDEDPQAQLLESAADAFGVTVGPNDLDAATRAMRTAAQPQDMAHAALFLRKLHQPVDPHDLQAVYAALVWDAGAVSMRRNGIELDIEAASSVRVAEGAGERLEQLFASGIGAAASESLQLPAATTIDTQDDASHHGRRAIELLNEQDDSSVAYAYGSLPVLVAGQLIELDVVLLRDRNGAENPHAMRRLVMTLNTETLGRVEVAAQALGSRLTIAIKTQTTAASDALARHADEVREIVTQLGWSVEAIAYEIDSLDTRAARSIVQHVLKAGSVDRMV